MSGAPPPPPPPPPRSAFGRRSILHSHIDFVSCADAFRQPPEGQHRPYFSAAAIALLCVMMLAEFTYAGDVAPLSSNWAIGVDRATLVSLGAKHAGRIVQRGELY
eukprot:2111477-Prymnesium_polylepis.2